jgi:pheromone shutdown protein TraB
MFDCLEIATEVETPPVDPRLGEQFLRCIPGTDELGTVLLVGVVHDHPASVFRVAHLLESFTPEVLALELPPLAMPLFRMYAENRFTPPKLGGEMSMAIQAAGNVRTVGIDAPNQAYLRLIAEELLTDRVSLSVTKSVLKDVTRGFAHALACRLGAVIGAITPLRLQLYSHIEYDCSLLESPAVQAEHESRHVSQRQAFLRAIKTPPTIRRIDEIREAGMVTRIQELRTEGEVVAIIGVEHLDTLETQLR